MAAERLRRRAVLLFVLAPANWIAEGVPVGRMATQYSTVVASRAAKTTRMVFGGLAIAAPRLITRREVRWEGWGWGWLSLTCGHPMV